MVLGFCLGRAVMENRASQTDVMIVFPSKNHGVIVSQTGRHHDCPVKDSLGIVINYLVVYSTVPVLWGRPAGNGNEARAGAG